MKSKAFKIIFWVSFIPYILVFISGVAGAINGMGFLINTHYGIDGFLLGIVGAIYTLLFVIPVIPICIIIEISYGIKNIVLKKITLKLYAVLVMVICVIVVATIGTVFYSYEITSFGEKINAKKMINQAEEKIVYNDNTTIIGGIFDINGYESNTILIDFDMCEVGFLIDSGYPTFWKVRLDKANSEKDIIHIKKDYYLQANIPLGEGGRLITFYNEPENIHRTIAFILEKKDGSIYYADRIIEKDTGYERFTGLNWSKFFVGANVKYDSYCFEEETTDIFAESN